MRLYAEPWTIEGHRDWRWVRTLALWPTRTFDAGWVWPGQHYWRWQCSWGWGFWDDYPYRNKESIHD